MGFLDIFRISEIKKENEELNGKVQKLSNDELKAVIEKFFEYRFECEFQEVDE